MADPSPAPCCARTVAAEAEVVALRRMLAAAEARATAVEEVVGGRVAAAEAAAEARVAAAEVAAAARVTAAEVAAEARAAAAEAAEAAAGSSRAAAAEAAADARLAAAEAAAAGGRAVAAEAAAAGGRAAAAEAAADGRAAAAEAAAGGRTVAAFPNRDADHGHTTAHSARRISSCVCFFRRTPGRGVWLRRARATTQRPQTRPRPCCLCSFVLCGIRHSKLPWW